MSFKLNLIQAGLLKDWEQTRPPSLESFRKKLNSWNMERWLFDITRLRDTKYIPRILEILLKSAFFCREKGKSTEVLLHYFIVLKIWLEQPFGYLSYLTKWVILLIFVQTLLMSANLNISLLQNLVEFRKICHDIITSCHDVTVSNIICHFVALLKLVFNQNVVGELIFETSTFNISFHYHNFLNFLDFFNLSF